MKMKEIRELSDEEVRTELERLRRHAFDLRAQAVTEKLGDPSLITKTKRDIARLLTAIRDRQAQADLQTADQQA